MSIQFIKKKTMSFRHGIVKTIAPNLYKQIEEFTEFMDSGLNGVPRPSTKFCLDHKIPIDLCCEIGVQHGINSKNILDELKPRRLFGIDPYCEYRDGDGRSKNFNNYLLDMMFKLKDYTNFTLLKMPSDVAVDFLQSYKLDFVYVDGGHEYSQVLRDLENYYPLVREGGIIAGHDIWWEDVSTALTDFCEKNALNFKIHSPDWIIRK